MLWSSGRIQGVPLILEAPSDCHLQERLLGPPHADGALPLSRLHCNHSSSWNAQEDKWNGGIGVLQEKMDLAEDGGHPDLERMEGISTEEDLPLEAHVEFTVAWQAYLATRDESEISEF